MALFHANNVPDWEFTIPVTFVSAGYQHTVKGFRVLVQTPQVKESETFTRPGELLMVWHKQLTLCTGPDCPIDGCKIRQQVEVQTTTQQRPRLVVPEQDGHFGLN